VYTFMASLLGRRHSLPTAVLEPEHTYSH